VSSVSFVSSGNSLNIKAERRVAKTKTLATLLLNWTGIPETANDLSAEEQTFG
jgi:hypothetical protein